MRLSVNLHLFCVISVFISGNNASIKDLNAFRILMNFSMYLGQERGGCSNACVCMGTHSQPLLQNHLIDVYKT